MTMKSKTADFSKSCSLALNAGPVILHWAKGRLRRWKLVKDHHRPKQLMRFISSKCMSPHTLKVEWLLKAIWMYNRLWPVPAQHPVLVSLHREHRFATSLWGRDLSFFSGRSLTSATEADERLLNVPLGAGAV